MARHLIQSATTGDARIVGDAALAFFPGYVVVDTYDDGIPPAVFYGAGESDLRYVNVTELSDPASVPSVALRAAFRRHPLPHLEGVRLTAYGHSYLADDTVNTPGTRYVQRLTARWSPGNVQNDAVGGSTSRDVAIALTGGATTEWGGDRGGVVLIDCIANDYFHSGGSTTAGLTQFSNHLFAMLARLEAMTPGQPGAEATVTGAWSTIGGADFSGGGVHFTTDPAAYIEYTFTGTQIAVQGLGWAPGNDIDSLSILVDGTVRATQSPNDQEPSGGTAYGTLTTRVTGLSAGAHTVRVRKASNDSRQAWVDCFLPYNSTWGPPLVAVMHQVYAGTIPGAAVDAYNAVVDTVCAQFPNAVVVQAEDGFTPDMLGADGLHPNDKGMAHIADAIQDAVAATGYRQGLNRLTA